MNSERPDLEPHIKAMLDGLLKVTDGKDIDAIIYKFEPHLDEWIRTYGEGQINALQAEMLQHMLTQEFNSFAGTPHKKTSVHHPIDQFIVVCDETINPPDVVNANNFRVLIDFSLLKSEFPLFRIQGWRHR